MKVIPVIDVLNGIVVHAIRGERSKYQPLQSILTKATAPVSVAEDFRALGFSELYVADLDGIIDCSTNFGFLRQIVDKTGLKLMVDAGVTSFERAQKLFDSGASKLVIGTETLQNKNFVAKAVERFGSDRVIVSLDLKGNMILAKEGFDGCSDPSGMLKEFGEMGVLEVIVLDLLRVGSGEGVNIALLKKALNAGLGVYVGGGVRNMADLVELNNLGVRGALVATALHSGKISIADLKKQGFI